MNVVRITQQTAILAGLTSINILAYSSLVLAQQRACVTTDESTTVCGILQTKPSKENNNYPVFEKEGFAIKLNGCKKISTDVIECQFALKNLRDTNRGVTFTSARLFDDSGISTDGEGGGFSKGEGGAHIPPGISLRGFTRFKGVAKNSKLVLLELSFNGEDGRFMTQFKL
jgi:hypothetical protein